MVKNRECDICGNIIDMHEADDWLSYWYVRAPDGRFYHDKCIIQKYHREWRAILVDD